MGGDKKIFGGSLKGFFVKNKKQKRLWRVWGWGLSEKNMSCAGQTANANEVKTKPVDWRDTERGVATVE